MMCADRLSQPSFGYIVERNVRVFDITNAVDVLNLAITMGRIFTEHVSTLKEKIEANMADIRLNLLNKTVPLWTEASSRPKSDGRLPFVNNPEGWISSSGGVNELSTSIEGLSLEEEAVFGARLKRSGRA